MLGLSSLAAKVLAIVLLMAGSASGGFALGFHWEKAAFATYKAEVALANEKATQAAIAEQRRLDSVSVAAAQKEAGAQAAMTAAVKRQLSQVKKHVQDTRTRVPYGVVRLLDGAAGGALADTLVLPTGKSDDTLSPLGWHDLARSVLGNYGTCRANAEQLDALIAAYRASKR